MLFSIVVPVLNSEKFLEETLSSILSQKGPDIECIVVDGGSLDLTHDIVKKFSPYVKLLRAQPLGEPDAINRGFEVSSGDIVAYIDSDDVYLPGAFQSACNCFEDGFSWCYGKGLIIDSKGFITRKFVTKFKELFQKEFNFDTLSVLDYIVQPTVFIKRSIWKEVGLFRKDYKFSFEYDYWLRLAGRTSPAFMNRYIAAWRHHPGSISVQSPYEEARQAISIGDIYGPALFRRLLRRLVNYPVPVIYSLLGSKGI